MLRALNSTQAQVLTEQRTSPSPHVTPGGNPAVARRWVAWACPDGPSCPWEPRFNPLEAGGEGEGTRNWELGTGNWERKGFPVSEPQLLGAAGLGHVSGCSPWRPQPRRADSCDSEGSLCELAASSMPNGPLLLCPGGRLCFSNVLLLFTFSPSSPPPLVHPQALTHPVPAPLSAPRLWWL